MDKTVVQAVQSPVKEMAKTILRQLLVEYFPPRSLQLGSLT
jgi:hypothetical protein